MASKAAYDARYYANHKERYQERGREWYLRNRGRVAALARQRYLNQYSELTYASYQGSAKRRGLEFVLTREVFDTLTAMDCHYCGRPPIESRSINGIDRIDNALEYVDGNMVTACSTCNYAKRAMSASEFIGWARLVVARNMGA
jgi:5-methylcytosine-specific restriction endonuclease McrA